MKKFIVSSLLVAVVAQAQTQTSSTAPATADVSGTKPPTAAAGSVSVQESEVAPKESRKWGALFISENYATIDDVERLGGDAPTWSVSQVGANYKLNEYWTLEGRQTFSAVTNREELLAGSTQNGGSASAPNNIHSQQAFELLDPMIIAKIKTKSGILGSNTMSHSFRFEAPLGKVSREQNRVGLLRYDTTLAWAVTPKVEASFGISPRIIMGTTETPETSGTTTNGAVYRLVGGPAMTYNFNDKINSYGALTFDHRSTEFGKGTLVGSKLNLASYEVGMNFNLALGDGNLSLNPAISSDLDLNEGSGSIATEQSRLFSHETNTYYLAVTATY